MRADKRRCKNFSTGVHLRLSAVLIVLFVSAVCAEELKEGATFDLGGTKATLKKIDALPYVESDYTKRFKFDTFDNPKLKELRDKYKLDEVVATGKDEFDKMVLLNDWTHQQFKKFGTPSANPKGALEILKSIDEGNTFFCAHYGQVMVSAAASLGWVDRDIALRRHQDSPKSGAPEHTVTEIWSNQYKKWVMLDPTANMYLEKDGVPLNSVEIRQDWFYNDGKGLIISIGKERKKYKKADLPIFLQRFPNFGDLTVDPHELEKYGFIGYIPNTNLMDAGEDYGKMFIVKDKLCDGTKWHERVNPANPAVDPYFPLGQAALSLSPDGAALKVELKTMTPNFKNYSVQIDGAGWKIAHEPIAWPIHAGANKLEVRTVNHFGVEGPVSTVDVEAK